MTVTLSPDSVNSQRPSRAYIRVHWSRSKAEICPVQIRLGLGDFLLRSRRGPVAGGAPHLFFCVCWVFQGRIT